MRTTTPAPITNPAMEPKSSQLPIKPRLRSGVFRDEDRRPGIFTADREALRHLHSSSRIGAQIPIVAYDGIRPIQKVLIDMITIVIARILPTIFIAQHPEEQAA